MTNGTRQRSSILTGLLLIALGFLFLLQRFEPHLGIGHLVRRYWPLLLIVWGIAKLIDHFTTSRTGEGRPPILSGPEAAIPPVEPSEYKISPQANAGMMLG